MKRFAFRMSVVFLAASLMTAAENVSACDLVADPGRYSGKAIRVQAVYVNVEHGSFLRPYPSCKGQNPPPIRIASTPEGSLV
jgi:hypothetical protein